MKLNVNIEPMGIQQFYDCVAMEMGYTNIANLQYDCRKIKCSEKIQSLIFEHYNNEGVDKVTSGMYWACFGPKADENWHNFEVEVEDGFIKEEASE